MALKSELEENPYEPPIEEEVLESAYEYRDRFESDEDFRESLAVWPRCPECGRRRITRCPICKTSGDLFPLGDGDFWNVRQDPNAQEPADGCACGNARAYGFSDEPLIRMRNTAVHPGKDKLADMIASVDNGYYLTKTQNGQADTTGEFMFGVTMGYEIKKGKLGRALLDTTISGVAFDMLKTVDMVGDTVVWSSSGFCGKKQPMAVGMGGPALRCKVKIGGR